MFIQMRIDDFRPNIKLVALFAFLLGAINAYPALAEAPQDLLESTVNKLNQSLPKKVSSTIRQETSLAGHNMITHRYTILNMSTGQLSIKISNDAAQITRTNCSDSEVARLLKMGISIKFLYYGNDGGLGGTVIVNSRKCRF